MAGEKLTKADVEKIQAEINQRKTELRPKILEDVKTARAQGDLSENFEYYAARKANGENNSRIEYLEKMLRNATIIDENEIKGITINNKVKVKFVDDDSEEIYKIVTSIRSDSTQNKVSIESPLGKALIGHEVGDIVKVTLDNGSSYELKVLEITEDSDEDDLKVF